MSRSRRRILNRKIWDMPTRRAVLTEKHAHKGGPNWFNRVITRADNARRRREDRQSINEQMSG